MAQCTSHDNYVHNVSDHFSKISATKQIIDMLLLPF